MKYQWDSSLETGHPRIDNQHKQLIDMVNKINEAAQEGKGKEEIIKAVKFLADYTVMHFEGEEKLQEIYSYPDYAAHKQIHEGAAIFCGKEKKSTQRRNCYIVEL